MLENRGTVVDEDCVIVALGRSRLREGGGGFPAPLVGTYRNVLRGWFDNPSDNPESVRSEGRKVSGDPTRPPAPR